MKREIETGGTASSRFLTTRWTLVQEAAVGGDVQAREALGSLFRAYWKPLYRYVRRSGKSPQDAEDLIQGFFVHLVEGRGLRLADRERGRFRGFLLGALKHYLIDDWRRSLRQKRGGLADHLSLEWRDAETGLGLEPGDSRSPDRWFDREWAMALLEKVLNDLEKEEADFARWKPYLGMQQESLPYAEVARELGLSEGAVRVAVHRLRKRYRKRVRSEIAATLADPSYVEDEMQALFASLADDLS